jgi:hypothetical protein
VQGNSIIIQECENYNIVITDFTKMISILSFFRLGMSLPNGEINNMKYTCMLSPQRRTVREPANTCAKLDSRIMQQQKQIKCGARFESSTSKYEETSNIILHRTRISGSLNSSLHVLYKYEYNVIRF